jgi:hypothetical protein
VAAACIVGALAMLAVHLVPAPPSPAEPHPQHRGTKQLLGRREPHT